MRPPPLQESRRGRPFCSELPHCRPLTSCIPCHVPEARVSLSSFVHKVLLPNRQCQVRPSPVCCCKPRSSARIDPSKRIATETGLATTSVIQEKPRTVDPRCQLYPVVQRRVAGPGRPVRRRLRAAAGRTQRSDWALLRGAGLIPVPHRSDRLGRDRRRVPSPLGSFCGTRKSAGVRWVCRPFGSRRCAKTTSCGMPPRPKHKTAKYSSCGKTGNLHKVSATALLRLAQWCRRRGQSPQVDGADQCPQQATDGSPPAPTDSTESALEDAACREAAGDSEGRFSRAARNAAGVSPPGKEVTNERP